MTKQQVIILRVKYDDEESRSPHTWDWSGLLGADREVEVMNHGKIEDADRSSD